MVPSCFVPRPANFIGGEQVSANHRQRHEPGAFAVKSLRPRLVYPLIIDRKAAIPSPWRHRAMRNGPVLPPIGCPHTIDRWGRDHRMVFLGGRVGERHRRRKAQGQSSTDGCEVEERSPPQSNDGRWICHAQPKRISSHRGYFTEEVQWCLSYSQVGRRCYWEIPRYCLDR